MYIRKEIKEFMNKMPKEMKLPKHWRKFVNEQDREFNLIIKSGKELECTNCGKHFYIKTQGNNWYRDKEICPFCHNIYEIRRSNLKNYFFLYDLAVVDNVDNKLVLRYFEVRRTYIHSIKKFKDNIVEYARIVPEYDIELVNNRFLKSFVKMLLFPNTKFLLFETNEIISSKEFSFNFSIFIISLISHILVS